MSSYDDWYPSSYLKADDAIDNAMDLTITAFQQEKMQDGTFKPTVSFKEDKRKLVLNVTNKNFLVQLTRSKDPEDAIGQRVRLVAVEAEFQGKPCMALRLRRIPSEPAAGSARRARPPGKTTGEDLDDNIPF